MNEHRRQILEMLAAGKITAAEAERLITAVETPVSENGENARATSAAAATATKARPKYLRVLVEADETMIGLKGGMTTVNVRVPMQLLRAGVRLAALIPQQAHDNLDAAFNKHGVPLTLSQIKPENLDELIEHLDDLTVDVDGGGGKAVKVKVFCE